MAGKDMQANRVATAQIFDCDSLPIPPGSKSAGRLPRGAEEDTAGRTVGWWIGGTATVALLVGVLIGRFLLP